MSIECCICLTDKPILPVSLECHHHFCYLCIKGVKLSNIQASCPLCRAPISNDILDKMTIDDCLEEDDDDEPYQWLYSGKNNGWWRYDKENNKELERMYQDKEEICSLNIGNMEFEIDFENMRQINRRNGFMRDIKRIDKDAELDDIVKGVAGLLKKTD